MYHFCRCVLNCFRQEDFRVLESSFFERFLKRSPPRISQREEDW